MGRLTKDPDVRYSQSGSEAMAIARYTLAVNRAMKKDGQPTADFISCVAFGKKGEFVEKYLKKGMKIVISGHIQTGSYEKDGQKYYNTDVVVDEHFFCESRGGNATQSTSPDGFMDIPDGLEDELPFA